MISHTLSLCEWTSGVTDFTLSGSVPQNPLPHQHPKNTTTNKTMPQEWWLHRYNTTQMKAKCVYYFSGDTFTKPTFDFYQHHYVQRMLFTDMSKSTQLPTLTVGKTKNKMTLHYFSCSQNLRKKKKKKKGLIIQRKPVKNQFKKSPSGLWASAWCKSGLEVHTPNRHKLWSSIS